MQTVKTSEELKGIKGTVVVDFGAHWCPPCNKLVPIYTEVSQLDQFKDISFVKVDIDEASDLASEYGVMSIPTLVVIKDGKTITSQSGFLSKTALTAWVTKHSA